jgi:hypothetical protein
MTRTPQKIRNEKDPRAGWMMTAHAAIAVTGLAVTGFATGATAATGARAGS